MTMHLAHPSLSLSGKRKGKRKFRNADEARKARELQESWENLKQKWGVPEKSTKSKDFIPLNKSYKLSVPASRDTTRDIKSSNEWVTGPVNTKPTPKYTGTKIIGIGTMHKSNAVPVFSDDQAKDISTMRRN